MGAVKIEITLPREVYSTLGKDRNEVSTELKKMGVLNLVQKGQISSGKGAEVLRMSKQDFLELLADEGLPYFNISPEQLESDLKVARQMRRRFKH